MQFFRPGKNRNVAGRAVSDRERRSSAILAAVLPPAARRYIRGGLSLFSIGESVPYDESDSLACARTLPRQQARDAAAPRKDLFPGSNGFYRPACAVVRCRPHLHFAAMISTDDALAHFCYRGEEMRGALVAFLA